MQLPQYYKEAVYALARETKGFLYKVVQKNQL